MTDRRTRVHRLSPTAENAYADAHRDAHLAAAGEASFARSGRVCGKRPQRRRSVTATGNFPRAPLRGETVCRARRCPRPPDAPSTGDWRRAAAYRKNEVLLLDGNAAARDHDFFSVGALAVPTSAVVAGIDLEGDAVCPHRSRHRDRRSSTTRLRRSVMARSSTGRGVTSSMSLSTRRGGPFRCGGTRSVPRAQDDVIRRRTTSASGWAWAARGRTAS